MTVSIVTRVTIKSSPKEVFKYLSNTKYHFLWNPHLQTLTPVQKLKKGSRYKTTILLLGVRVDGHNEVSRLELNKELEIRNSSGMIKYCAA